MSKPEDRKARCSYYGRSDIIDNKRRHKMECNYDCEETIANGGCHCQCEKPSSMGKKLPFFREKPDEPRDEFYCGCWGWD